MPPKQAEAIFKDPNIFLFFGEDRFRLKRQLDSLCKTICEEKPGLTVKKLSAQDDLESEISGLSLFSNEKVVLIELNEFDPDNLLEAITNRASTSNKIILFQLSKLDKRQKLYKSLEKLCNTTEVEAFSPWKPAETIEWLQEIAEEENISIDKIALQSLVEHYGNDSTLLYSELKRLECYAAGNKIDHKQVQMLCESVENMFDLADYLLNKQFSEFAQKVKRITLFQNPLALVAGLQTVFRGYLQLKSMNEERLPSAEIAKSLGKNPWKVGQDLQKLKNTSFNYLLKVLESLNQIEEEIKTGFYFEPDLQFKFRFLQLATF